MIPQDDLYITEKDMLKIYVIGYQAKGESIIVSLGDNKFVGVIDCYKEDDLFITKQILDNLNVCRLDFLCWTHTDQDHTRGLSELFRYVSDTTTWIMPEGISYRELLTQIRDEHGKEYNEIFGLANKYVGADYFVSANQNTEIFNFNLVYQDFNYNFRLQSFSPLSKIVRNRSIKSVNDIVKLRNQESEERNLYSVGLLLSLTSNNAIKVCFTSDLVNKTITQMNSKFRKAIFERNTIIQMPHHGSKHSDELLKGNIAFFEHAFTTSFQSKKMPNEDIVAGYKSIGPVSKTGKGDDRYGVIKYEVPIIQEVIPGIIKVQYDAAAGLA